VRLTVAEIRALGDPNLSGLSLSLMLFSRGQSQYLETGTLSSSPGETSWQLSAVR
jgi:hypothetical protein